MKDMFISMLVLIALVCGQTLNAQAEEVLVEETITEDVSTETILNEIVEDSVTGDLPKFDENGCIVMSTKVDVDNRNVFQRAWAWLTFWNPND